MSLNAKQKKAIELLTCGEGYNLHQVAQLAEVSDMTLYRWRNAPEYKEFQEEIEKINEVRWQAAIDAARESCLKLCKNGNQKMVEFVMKNAGYNPSQKVEAKVETDVITINIEGEDE